MGIKYNISGNNCPRTLRFSAENMTTFLRNIECACEVPVLMRNSVHPLELVVASRDEAHVMLSRHYLDCTDILEFCARNILVPY